MISIPIWVFVLMCIFSLIGLLIAVVGTISLVSELCVKK